MVSQKPQRLLLTTTSINGLTGTAMTLATAALATWIFIVDGTSAHPSAAQRCYACGPLASHWFPESVQPPSCDNFTETENYTVNCGPGFDSCTTIIRRDQHVLSKLCGSNMTDSCERKTLENMTEDYFECKCTKPLCNNKITPEQIGNLLVEDVSSTMTTMKGNVANSEEHKPALSSSEEVNTEPHTESKEVTVTPTAAGKDQSDNVNTIAAAKGSVATPAAKENALPVHALPQPAALGQKDKNSSDQGAPIDDEEDTPEGSGSRIDTDHKSTVLPTLAPITEHSTVKTTEAPKNFAPICHSYFAIIHALSITVVMAVFF